MAEAFTFELVSPEKLILSGEASEVVVPGTEGYFTIMANHAPFMSTIKPGVIEVRTGEGKIERYVVYGGFADISLSGCTILAEQAEHVDEFDNDAFADRLKRAKDDVANATHEGTRSAAEQFFDQLTHLDGHNKNGILS